MDKFVFTKNNGWHALTKYNLIFLSFDYIINNAILKTFEDIIIDKLKILIVSLPK